MSDRIYTGIGSRQTPETVLAWMFDLGRRLGEAGWTLRSGAAFGADSSFEAGCDAARGRKEIFLPWRRFNNHVTGYIMPEEMDPRLIQIARRTHPVWDKLSSGVRKLHARNVFQVLGKDLETPSRFLVCWTPGGNGGGGTGQAIRLARESSVPIFDLANPTSLAEVRERFLSVAT